MTDTNTNNSTVTNKDSKSKQEIKQEQREKKYAAKLESNRVKKLAQLEKKKAKLTVRLNKANNPKWKSHLQDKIDETDKKIQDLKDLEKAAVNRPFGLVMRTWAKGLGKETGRVAWYKRREILKDFITVVIVCAILAIIFFAIDMIIITIGSR